MKRTLLVSGIFLLMMVSFSEVYACSIPEFAVDFLPSADVIVYATVVKVDESGFNSILSVVRYFKGSGSKYLPVITMPPVLLTAARSRQYPIGCASGRTRVIGETGYFALISRNNGTFSDYAIRGDVGVVDVSGGERMIHFKRIEDESKQVYRELTLPVTDFERLLLELGGGTAVVPPDSDTRYPLSRFLSITTETGMRYWLNPDNTITQLDPRTYPVAISPDGTHYAFQLDESTFAFTRYGTLPESSSYGDDSAQTVLYYETPGRGFQFSPDSNFVTVWDENRLTIYIFNNELNFDFNIGERSMDLKAIGETSIRSGERPAQVSWSGDSTTLTFRDDMGLWQWKIFDDAEPALLVPAKELNTFSLLETSRSGRYVRYGENDSWSLFDVETGETYQNVLATPNESNLIYVNVEPPGYMSELAFPCQIPLSETCPLYVNIQPENLVDVFWYKYNQMVTVGCSPDECALRSYSWNRSVMRYEDGSVLSTYPLVIDVAYDDQFDQLAIVTDDYSLAIQVPPFAEVCCNQQDHYLLDLSEKLDSPVAHVEWDLPIFYREPSVIK